MLRTAATQLRRVQTQFPRNARFITSAQKRSLKKEQITPTVEPPAPAGGTTNTTSGSTGGGGGGGYFLPLVAAVAAAGGGGAYYMDLIPSSLLGKEEEKETEEPKEGVKSNDDANAKKTDVAKEEEKAEVIVKLEEKTEVIVKKEEKKQEKAEKTDHVGNRVLKIQAPSGTGRISQPLPEVKHREGGSRVTVEQFSSVYGGKSFKEGTKVDTSDSAPTGSTAVAAKDELTASSIGRSMIDEELAKAHATMKASMDDTYLKDLENLNPSDLKIRIVQLASEMSERTKWEAVRLREFLAMKEKEVGEKYLEMMQKQRLEFEDLLARRMREQEYAITKAANEALQSKEASIESVVNAAASAQKAEYEAALKSTKDSLEREIGAKHEAEFGAKLAESKNSYIKDLEEKLAVIMDLSSRMEQAEQNLQISRNFESGSQKAHRVSAAALALAEKMETSKGATEEFAALKAAAVENGVIGSALEKVPSSVKIGIPTLSELQTNFDSARKVGRQAAYVPQGRTGLEGQLAGMLFATLTMPPGADSPPPSDENVPDGRMSDYVLAKAKRHVQLGELEQAVSMLDQLKGQTAFTLKDWKSDAMDRIAVDKALKVIKMECALMNKNMSG